jgi:hypothetical protein
MQRFLQIFSIAHKAPFEPVCKPGEGGSGRKSILKNIAKVLANLTAKGAAILC